MSQLATELAQLAERARTERDCWAVMIARDALKARDEGRVDEYGTEFALAQFSLHAGRAALADDLRALELFGVFAKNVTLAMIKARWPLPSDRAVTVTP